MSSQKNEKGRKHIDADLMLQRGRQEGELKLNALRMQLEAGIAELERGDFIEIDEADLGSYLENLTIDR